MAGQQNPSKPTGITKSTKTNSTTTGPKVGRRNGASTTAGAGSDPPHVCGICNKCFDRRDLRDRHKRRCARSATKVKVSKRKSCLACAQSKLGCDLDTPACSRCVGRGTNCEYAVPPRPTLSVGILPPKPATARPTSASSLPAVHRASPYAKPGSGLPYHTYSHSTPVEMLPLSATSSTSSSGYPTPPFHDNVMPWHDNFPGYQSFDLFGSLTSQPFLPHVPSTPSSAHPSGCFEGSDLDSLNHHEMAPTFHDWYQDHGASSGFQVHQNNMHGPWHANTEHRHLREADQPHFCHSGPLENHSFSLFNALNIPVHEPSLSPTQSPGHVEANSSFFAAPAMPFEVSSSDSWRVSPVARTKSMTGSSPGSGAGFFDLQSLASLAATTNLQSAQKTLFADLDVVKLIQRYPAMLLQESFYPPFVHHELYRSAQGGVAGPLANALCCVSALSSMNPSNESFVYNMVNTEREHLVRGFHSCSISDINTLGVVHAICLYQIIGLLNVKDPKQIKAAEVQHPFFLKMVRRLCQESLYSSTGMARTREWQSWIVGETFRRIVFLVNIVNTLARRAHARNPSYYEALDEDLIFSLALPAPDSMWKACTAEEWECAKRNLGWNHRRQRTVHMVIDRLGGGHTDEENRTWFEDFQPLSLLIIACVRLHL